MKNQLRFGIVFMLAAFALMAPVKAALVAGEPEHTENTAVEAGQDNQNKAAGENESGEAKYQGVEQVTVPKTKEGKVAVWATAVGTTLLFLALFLKSRKLDQ